MRKTSGQPVISRVYIAETYPRMALTISTSSHPGKLVRSLCTTIYTHLSALFLPVLYPSEQLLYPVSTALIIRTTNTLEII